MKTWLCALAATAALCTAAPGASADEGSPRGEQDTGSDEVLLKNGGVVRGTVVSLDPGQEVSVLVAGSRTPRTIPWGQVADVQRGKYADDEELPPPAQGYGDVAPDEGEAPSAADEPGVVRLHIQSDDPDVRLYQTTVLSQGMVGGYGFALTQTEQRCAPPCNQVIDARRGQGYYFAGDGVPATDNFSLSGYQGDVTAHVESGSGGLIAGGSTMAVFGGLGLIASPIFFVLGNVESYDEEIIMPSGNLAGGVLLASGAALLAGGIVMMVQGRTSYELEQGRPDGQTARRRSPRQPRYWLGEF